MEEKKMRELKPEEMELVTGGKNGISGFGQTDPLCPHCQSTDCTQISEIYECNQCGATFLVYN